MQAIRVHYLPWTSTRSAKYIATAMAGRMQVSCGSIPAGTKDSYRLVAERFCDKMGWDMHGDMLGGTLADGSQVFVFDHPLSRKDQ
jgi:hypothetical protein